MQIDAVSKVLSIFGAFKLSYWAQHYMLHLSTFWLVSISNSFIETTKIRQVRRNGKFGLYFRKIKTSINFVG